MTHGILPDWKKKWRDKRPKEDAITVSQDGQAPKFQKSEGNVDMHDLHALNLTATLCSTLRFLGGLCFSAFKVGILMES